MVFSPLFRSIRGTFGSFSHGKGRVPVGGRIPARKPWSSTRSVGSHHEMIQNNPLHDEHIRFVADPKRHSLYVIICTHGYNIYIYPNPKKINV